MSDAVSALRAPGVSDLLTLLLARTPAGQEEPIPQAQAQAPARDFAAYVLAAAAALGVTPPLRPRTPNPPKVPPRPPARERPRDGRANPDPSPCWA